MGSGRTRYIDAVFRFPEGTYRVKPPESVEEAATDREQLQEFFEITLKLWDESDESPDTVIQHLIDDLTTLRDQIRKRGE